MAMSPRDSRDRTQQADGTNAAATAHEPEATVRDEAAVSETPVVPWSTPHLPAGNDQGSSSSEHAGAPAIHGSASLAQLPLDDDVEVDDVDEQFPAIVLMPGDIPPVGSDLTMVITPTIISPRVPRDPLVQASPRARISALQFDELDAVLQDLHATPLSAPPPVSPRPVCMAPTDSPPAPSPPASPPTNPAPRSSVVSPTAISLSTTPEPRASQLESFSRGGSFVAQSVKSVSARLGRVAATVALGDDEEVYDKWDDYEDEEDDPKLGASVTGKPPRQPRRTLSGMSRNSSYSVSGKVHPETPRSSAEQAEDWLHEKRVTRQLLWHHIQTLIFSVFVAAVCMPIVTVMSAIHWSVEVPAEEIAEAAARGVTLAPVRPNPMPLQLTLMLQLVLPLAIYALLLYICMRRTWKLPMGLVAAVVATIAWSAITCGLFYKYNVSFWFYYIDLFVIVAAYVPCMCVVGWYMEPDKNTTTRQRFEDMAFVALLETLVAAATLVYCYFIMPLYFLVTNAWLQMVWICILHPLYFEITTGYIVRKALYRNSRLGRNHIVYFLAIVHTLVHTSALATSLQASIEPARILSITIIMYCVSKLIWRSTIIPRDLLVERLLHGWSFQFATEERCELARMVSVTVLTEILLENASAILTPFMMYRMFKEPIFMMVVPNIFFNNGGTYPAGTVVALIAMLLGFTILFDGLFLWLNYYTNQRLPLINTWRRIKKAQGWYMLFLVYAFACMGVLFLFLTMMVLPRAAYCKSDNYCDCSTNTYKTICQGEYISLLVDYLVNPY